ncbi:hypothetical protein ACEPAI_4967 [Sanghuangporus weigelae]
MPLVLISNPKCGDGQGHIFVRQHVVPLLAQHGVRVDKQIVTTAAGQAGPEFLMFVDQFMVSEQTRVQVSLVLASGDGTLHEIVDAVYKAEFVRPLHISVALVPTGTANALYSSLFASTLAGLHAGEITSLDYKLCSVKSLLRNQNDVVPLTITKATVRSPSHATATEHFSAVVTSTALHASILHDSESLREQIPDLSRFKIVAEKNISRWYPSTVSFRPSQGDELTIYDHRVGKFVDFVGDNNNLAEPTIHGPFSYFVSTVNVDRLEPSFVISPLYSRIRPRRSAMDITVIRPHRDPAILGDSEDDRIRFADRLGTALQAAYRDGAHIALNYFDDGSTSEVKVGGEFGLRSLVEYIRCTGSWRWLNTGTEATHLCVDGTIVTIEAGGEAECQIIDPSALRFDMFV